MDDNQTHYLAPAHPLVSGGGVSQAPPPSHCVLPPHLLQQEDKMMRCWVSRENTPPDGESTESLKKVINARTTDLSGFQTAPRQSG